MGSVNRRSAKFSQLGGLTITGHYEMSITDGTSARNVDELFKLRAFVFGTSPIPFVTSLLPHTSGNASDDDRRTSFVKKEWDKDDVCASIPYFRIDQPAGNQVQGKGGRRREENRRTSSGSTGSIAIRVEDLVRSNPISQDRFRGLPKQQ